MVRDKARACPRCGHPTRLPHAARKGALRGLPAPAALPAPTRARLVLGATGASGRAPLRDRLGEMDTAWSRGGCVGLAAVGASMIMGLGVLYVVFGQWDILSGAGLLAAGIALLAFAGGLFNYGLLSHALTAIAFTALGALCAVDFYGHPSPLPAAGLVVSALVVDYVWAVRKQLRTGNVVSFDRLLRPFQRADPLTGVPPQNALIELNNQFAEAGSIRAVIPEDVLALEAVHRVRLPYDLPGETRILYARYLRHFLEDDFLDDGEKEEIAALERLLRLPADVRASVRRAVAAWLYEARAREAMHDGRVDDDERALLERIVADLELPAGEAERIFLAQARARVEAAARAAAADRVVLGDEAAEVEDMAAHLGVPIEDGVGGISRATLEWHRQGRARQGGHGVVVDVFVPHPGEVVHLTASAELRREESPAAGADPGTVRVTSRRLRFSGAAVREEIPLEEIEGIRPRADAVEIQQALGPARFYSFPHDPAEADLFVQTLSRAMRAASAGGRP
jgi:hypothetical protein